MSIFGSKRTHSFADPATGTRLNLELPKSWRSVANRWSPICLLAICILAMLFIGVGMKSTVAPK
jgi:hypothetical protein